MVLVVESVVTGSQVHPAAGTMGSSLAAEEELAPVEEFAAVEECAAVEVEDLADVEDVADVEDQTAVVVPLPRRHWRWLVQLILLKWPDGLMLEGFPPLIRNGQCLRREPQQKGLLRVRLHIKDIADTLLQVLVFYHGVHDHHFEGGIFKSCKYPIMWGGQTATHV